MVDRKIFKLGHESEAIVHRPMSLCLSFIYELLSDIIPNFNSIYRLVLLVIALKTTNAHTYVQSSGYEHKDEFILLVSKAESSETSLMERTRENPYVREITSYDVLR